MNRDRPGRTAGVEVLFECVSCGALYQSRQVRTVGSGRFVCDCGKEMSSWSGSYDFRDWTKVNVLQNNKVRGIPILVSWSEVALNPTKRRRRPICNA